MVEIAVWELKEFIVSNVFVKTLTQAIHYWQLHHLIGTVGSNPSKNVKNELFFNFFHTLDQECNVEDSKLGNGVCDPEAAGLFACDYDSGDCSGTGSQI